MEIFSTLFDIYFANRFEIITTKNSNLNNSLIDIYVGDDGKLHKVQGGADSVLPFKSDIEVEVIKITDAGVSADQTNNITLPDGYLGFVAVNARGCRNNNSGRVGAYISATDLSLFWSNVLAVPIYEDTCTKITVGFIPGTTKSIAFSGWADGRILLFGIKEKS